jgi:hypothetical protein
MAFQPIKTEKEIGMDVVEGETGSYRETGVGCDVEGTEEVSIEVEDAIDIKDEFSIEVEGAKLIHCVLIILSRYYWWNLRLVFGSYEANMAGIVCL